MKRKLTGLTLFLLCSLSVFAQQKVNGTVTDDSGEPLAGVAIFTELNGSTVSTFSDLEGNFTIQVPAGTALTFSSMGFISQEIPASDEMFVTLLKATTLLDASVVIGYGTVKKKDLLGKGTVSPGQEIGRSHPVHARSRPRSEHNFQRSTRIECLHPHPRHRLLHRKLASIHSGRLIWRQRTGPQCGRY